MGVSAKTVRHWISILEASFVVRRLHPFYENVGKRLIKSPKLYFTDVGLATYLLGIESESQMARDPLRGNLVENLVVMELIKARVNRGLDPQLYYFRDAHGHEVDVVFQSGRQLVPIEIKASQTFNTSFLKNLQYFRNLIGERSETGVVIYAGSQEQSGEAFRLLNYARAGQALSHD